MEVYFLPQIQAFYVKILKKGQFVLPKTKPVLWKSKLVL